MRNLLFVDVYGESAGHVMTESCRSGNKVPTQPILCAFQDSSQNFECYNTFSLVCGITWSLKGLILPFTCISVSAKVRNDFFLKFTSQDGCQNGHQIDFFQKVCTIVLTPGVTMIC